MRKTFIVAICCLVGVTAQIVSLHPSGNHPESELRVPSPIGQSGAKTFYADLNATFTWPDAKEYCKDQTIPTGLRIAAITKEDYTFLTLPLQIQILGKGKIYWTSGRDAQKFTQFAWDNEATDTTLVADGDQSGLPFYKSGYKTCVAFMIMKDGDKGRLAGLDCTAKYPVLCQTP